MLVRISRCWSIKEHASLTSFTEWNSVNNHKKVEFWNFNYNNFLLYPLSLSLLAPVACPLFYDRFRIISAPKESGMPQFGGRSESGDISDDRIQHILTEASSMIQKPSPQQHLQNHSNHHTAPSTPLSSMNHHNIDDTHSIEDSKSPPSCTSPFGKSRNNNNMKKYENDDISEEKVAKIYQEELTKLMTRGNRDSFPK